MEARTWSMTPVKDRRWSLRISSAKEVGRIMIGPFAPMTWNTLPLHCEAGSVSKVVPWGVCCNVLLPLESPAS